MMPDLQGSTWRSVGFAFLSKGTWGSCVATLGLALANCCNSPGLTASEEDGGVCARRHVPVLLGKYSGYTQVT